MTEIYSKEKKENTGGTDTDNTGAVMQVSDLKEICEKRVGHFKSYAKLSTDEVENLEKDIGHKFPEDYRELLMTYGCVESGSEEILGFGGPRYLDMVSTRNDLISSPLLNFPDNLCPICRDGFGNYECLQLLSLGKANVIWWVHDGNGYIHETIAPSFSVWLDEFCERARL